MDVTINESLERLDKLINQEQAKRDIEVAELHKTLDEARQGLQDSISMMEDQANQDLAAVKETLQQNHDDLLDQSKELQKTLSEQLETRAQELHEDKVSRQTLALMLDEVAVRLRSK